jgi:hypothetical protein
MPARALVEPTSMARTGMEAPRQEGFFFEKKKQKTFYPPCNRGGVEIPESPNG